MLTWGAMQTQQTHLDRQMLARHVRVARSASAASLPRPGALAMPSSTGRPPPATTMSLQASTASVHRASPFNAAVACTRRWSPGKEAICTESAQGKTCGAKSGCPLAPVLTEVGCLLASRASRKACVRAPSERCGAFAA